jgi:TRAP-type C4-dicarboxylate transport system permease small subunit
MKRGLLGWVEKLARFLTVVAGCSLVALMLLTVADVVLRIFGRPILGAYEAVSFMGVLLFGCSLPFSSWSRQQIFVDFFINKFSRRVQSVFYLATRTIVIALFFWIGWNLFIYAAALQRGSEVSAALLMPFHPFAYILGVCCFVECLVLCCDIVKIAGGVFNE